MKPTDVVELFRRLRAINPEPATELAYRSPFELLVAVILSAQATDVSVNKVTARLFKVARTPRAIVDLGERRLKRHIASIGLCNSKARHIVVMAAQLLERHGGKVPRTRAELEALPGVGRKTANVILNTVFDEPVIAVDTHIFRVANRTGLARGRTVRAVEDRLMRVVPEEFRHGAHHWLILHGRHVCTARKPHCPECPIADLCAWPYKTLPDDATPPSRGRRTPRGR
ncbi:MAG: endonuclease III [Lysobacterales bacterium]